MQRNARGIRFLLGEKILLALTLGHLSVEFDPMQARNGICEDGQDLRVRTEGVVLFNNESDRTSVDVFCDLVRYPHIFEGE